MKITRKLCAIVLLLVFYIPLAWAQKASDGIYTSPGNPLIIGKRATPSPTGAGRQVPMVISPRYWRNPDSAAQITETARLYQLLSRRSQVPAAFMRQNYQTYQSLASTVTLRFRIIIMPDGSIKSSDLLDKEFSTDGTEYSSESSLLLEKEARKAIGTLRFAPANRQDTLLLPMKFNIQ
ncbi:hypothetical protein [Hymenobacter sp. DG25B]|uniref:hypothetical protein n=1 Tax=Hymenobacter sp. DG25B TaxID=1385664 RepID=UPI0012E01570|nr:hypothetical protein [Hymenobacter sp. DG25B]